jgi:metal-responsive CopG/Arc/MetJ family transcriptional regulator
MGILYAEICIMASEYRHLVIYDGQQLRKEVDRVAKAQGISRSKYILNAIRQKLDQEDRETT